MKYLPPLRSKAAEWLFRLYMVTIALDAGKFKQLLARKRYTKMADAWRVFTNFIGFYGNKQTRMRFATYSRSVTIDKSMLEGNDAN